MFNRQMARGFFMNESQVENKFFQSVTKGTGLSIIITLICVLIFALVIKLTYLSQGTVKTINQFIKVISIFISVFLCVRGKQGLIKGALIGGFSIVITHLIFSLIGGNVSFNLSFIIDIIFGLIVGAISGIIAVNVKKE